MILPPFFGIASKYDEPSIRRAIITYLNADISTYDAASSVANVTFLTTDSATFKTPLAIASLTYLSLDAVTNRSLSSIAHVTYGTADICTYDPPPQAPEITVFITGLVEDSTIELTWNTPYNNRCPITHYVLEYSNCFLTNLQTENNYTLVTEITDPLIEEYFRDNCEYQEFDKSRLLSQDLYRIASNNNYLIITEQSTGVGLSNFAIIDELSNGQSYLFRVAAVNCVGTGEFGYSGILTPLGPEHQYCDVLAFMQPDSTTDIYASLTEHSCREKTINHLAGVAVSSQSKFGPGSLYFDGVYESSPTPPTYSHLQIDHNYDTSLDTWSLIDDFTIELWVKPNTSPVYTNQTLVSCYYQNNYNTYENYQNRYWKLYIYGNTIKFNAYTENYDYQTGEFDSGYIDLTANISLPITKFTHIAVCRFNNYIRLFVDGIRYDRKYFNKDIIIPYNNNPYIIIGASQTDSYVYSDEFQTGRGTVNEPYIGYIDDLMLSKAARYGKNFIPQKYTEPPDCQDCGGYTLAASLTTIENDFIP
jgi:hypothetical protein